MPQLTQIINAVAEDSMTTEELLPVVYDELRLIAAQKMTQERPGQTLQATALVHEAWLRLIDADGKQWQNRAHFFGAAAEAMRRILVENARRKSRLKYGGDRRRIELDGLDLASGMPDEELLALDEALKGLEPLDPQGAEIIKLRFFAGLSHPQIASELGVSLSTVERGWTFCRTWLYQQIRDIH